MNNLILPESDFLNDAHVRAHLTRLDLSSVSVLTAAQFARDWESETRQWVKQAVAHGKLQLLEVETHQLEEVPAHCRSAALNYLEQYLLWYATKHQHTLVVRSRVWLQNTTANQQLICYSNPNLIFSAIRILHVKSTSKSRQLNTLVEQQYQPWLETLKRTRRGEG
ncbi:MAG: hypothetical protein AB7D35_13975 [Bacteroidales bacterium]|nr:hypothetical protein [Bacteroidales bacterium]